MDWAESLANEKIREAQLRGEFDNLAGAGKPLPEDDGMAGVPEELRVGFRLLKNAGMLPEEMQLRKEMVTLQDLLNACEQAGERQELARRLNAKKLRYRMLMEERGGSFSNAFAEYEDKIRRRLTDEE